MEALAKKSGGESMQDSPMGTINVCTKFYGNPSNTFWDPTDQQTDSTDLLINQQLIYCFSLKCHLWYCNRLSCMCLLCVSVFEVLCLSDSCCRQDLVGEVLLTPVEESSHYMFVLWLNLPS